MVEGQALVQEVRNTVNDIGAQCERRTLEALHHRLFALIDSPAAE
ncbi:hypothetical protein ACWDR0_10535 [Streptomyces sp. NPDC003691]